MKPCNCESGLPRRELRDAAGIFLTFICDRCEKKKRRGFNPAIFRTNSNYAVTGEEIDVGRFPGEDY